MYAMRNFFGGKFSCDPQSINSLILWLEGTL
jgi:hypothetical protein